MSETKEEYLDSLGLCKLEPKYCGPFKFLDRTGPRVYRLVLPSNTKSHNVFNVSFLKKNVHDIDYVIDWDVI